MTVSCSLPALDIADKFSAFTGLLCIPWSGLATVLLIVRIRAGGEGGVLSRVHTNSYDLYESTLMVSAAVRTADTCEKHAFECMQIRRKIFLSCWFECCLHLLRLSMPCTRECVVCKTCADVSWTVYGCWSNAQRNLCALHRFFFLEMGMCDLLMRMDLSRRMFAKACLGWQTSDTKLSLRVLCWQRNCYESWLPLVCMSECAWYSTGKCLHVTGISWHRHLRLFHMAH